MLLRLAAVALALLSLLLLADTPGHPLHRYRGAERPDHPQHVRRQGKKDYILESTGTGAAIFDYNGDGANDIFIANGTRLHARRAADPLAALSQRRQRPLHRGRPAGRLHAHRLGAGRLRRRFR